MADFISVIESFEHRWMRAWIQRDRRTLKKLTSRDFRLLFASKPGVILDAPSWLDAATARYRCTSYRYGDVYVRRHGAVAVFASQLDLEATMDGDDWSGQFWVTDLWRKPKIRRSWQLVERIVARTVDDPEIPGAVRSMQLWR